MADQVTNYKCPACTGPMIFSAATGKVECEYCGSTYDIKEIENMMAAESAKAEDAKASADAKDAAQSADEWEYTTEGWNEDGMKTYSCPSCGAELVCDENTAATSCPYCDNPTIVPGQFSGMLKPEYVIPFKIPKDKAVAALKDHYKGKALLPKSFTQGNHLDDIKGVYVPFWLYDGVASGTAFYDAKKEQKHREGNEEVTVTDHFKVVRAGHAAFEKIPADASSKMDDNLMDSIEPYDYSEIKEFSKAYLTGFMADKYDVSAEEDTPRVEERAKNTFREMLRETVDGYSSVSEERADLRIEQGKISYAMMPVWMLTTKWKDQKFTFAMNGQTGKMVGDLPVDMGKYWKIFFAVVAVLEVIFALIVANGDTGFAGMSTMGIVMEFVIVPLLIAFIVGAVLKGQMHSVFKAHQAAEYMPKKGLRLTRQSDRFVRQTIERRVIQQNPPQNGSQNNTRPQG